jgi:N,N-dimethylformamidase
MILAYTSELSVHSGESVELFVSTDHSEFEVDFVRLVSIDDGPGGPGFVEEVVEASIGGLLAGTLQAIRTGSSVVANGMFGFPAGLDLELTIWPTTPGEGRQVILAAGSGAWSLELDQLGRLTFALSPGSGEPMTAIAPEPLDPRSWYRVAASVDEGAGAVDLTVENLEQWRAVDRCSNGSASILAGVDVNLSTDGIVIAADPSDTAHFNGKIERPTLRSGEAVVAEWDFSRDMNTAKVRDVSGAGRDGVCRRMPTRSLTGHKFTGDVDDPADAPEQYGAIHFHDDDLEDAGWKSTLEYTLPESVASGIYAFRVRAGEEIDHFPLWVRSAPGASTERVLFLAPTNTYLAYANERLAEGDRGDALGLMKTNPIQLDPADEYRFEHHELGGSLYDVHSDGSGVCYSSRLRPILNMRPRYQSWFTDRMRNFGADFYISGWLEHVGIPFDVATDEDLHLRGAELLGRYDVVVTGTHPEYYTDEMLRAHEAHQREGGSLLYLGGNGFYWVTSMDPARPHLIESRRGHAGTRNWTGGPGEDRHSLSAQIGGLWRHRGRAPNALCGVGFSAVGWGPARPYTRTPASYDPAFAFAFEGIESAQIGADGLVLGAAAGDELDRYDRELGSPPGAVVLASSDNVEKYGPVIEDQLEVMPAQQDGENENVRADLTYFETGFGGSVLSAGSMCWGGAMAFDGYRNDVARLCENVIRHMLGERRDA